MIALITFVNGVDKILIHHESGRGRAIETRIKSTWRLSEAPALTTSSNFPSNIDPRIDPESVDNVGLTQSRMNSSS